MHSDFSHAVKRLWKSHGRSNLQTRNLGYCIPWKSNHFQILNFGRNSAGQYLHSLSMFLNVKDRRNKQTNKTNLRPVRLSTRVREMFVAAVPAFELYCVHRRDIPTVAISDVRVFSSSRFAVKNSPHFFFTPFSYHAPGHNPTFDPVIDARKFRGRQSVHVYPVLTGCPLKALAADHHLYSTLIWPVL